MKVFVVEIYNPYEGGSDFEVFASKDAAMNYANAWMKDHCAGEWDVSEYSEDDLVFSSSTIEAYHKRTTNEVYCLEIKEKDVK